MKKILKILVLSVFIYYTTFWSLSILKCDYLTFKHKNEFMHLPEVYTATMVKVMEYEDDHAILYRINATTTYGGELFCKKENGKWVYDGMGSGWSTRGTADDYIWPYGR